MERINENGIREVFCEADGRWYEDTVFENGQCFYLDERPDRFQYYPVNEHESRESFKQSLIEEEAASQGKELGNA